MVLQTPILPSALYGFRSGRQRPHPVGSAIAKFTFVTLFLQRQHAMTVRLAVRNFPFIAAGGPGLNALAGLTTIAPLTLVGLDGNGAL